MKPAWISGKEGLYCSEDPFYQQHMTYQFFVEAKRKFRKKVGIEMPFIKEGDCWKNADIILVVAVRRLKTHCRREPTVTSPDID